MGGHGALICYLKNPGKYRSVSAFSPICNPTQCPWGKKAFKGYLGPDEESWKEYDATCLVAKYDGPPTDILIDQVSMGGNEIFRLSIVIINVDTPNADVYGYLIGFGAFNFLSSSGAQMWPGILLLKHYL